MILRAAGTMGGELSEASGGETAGVRRGLVGALAVVVVGALLVWLVLRGVPSPPGCVVAAQPAVTMSVEQADSAATIAGVGLALGMPDHAVTVALATALQESGLRNLPGGDRDSAGLFQQRPSQGWGTYVEVTDPVHAATAFYERLRTEPDWATLSVTEAAQLVQHSAAPAAYAQWEPQARTMALALTGEQPAALRCHDLALTVPRADVAALAARELGTARLSGPQPTARGWAIASWLVAHAARLGLDAVSFDGQTWTAASGDWAATGPADGLLALHQAVDQAGSAPPG